MEPGVELLMVTGAAGTVEAGAADLVDAAVAETVLVVVDIGRIAEERDF